MPNLRILSVLAILLLTPLLCGCRGLSLSWGESEQDQLLKERDQIIEAQQQYHRETLYHPAASWQNDPLADRVMQEGNQRLSEIDERLGK